MRSLVFSLVIMLLLLFSGISSADRTLMKLSNTALGPLKLHRDMVLDLKQLKQLFPNHKVESGIGQQDGPDYTYYEIIDGKDVLFLIKALDDGPTKVDVIYIRSPLITDQYGLKVGMSYQDIKRIRPKLRHETDYHYHTYVGHPKENIVYEITGDFEGPDRTDFSEAEISNWTIRELLWVPR